MNIKVVIIILIGLMWLGTGIFGLLESIRNPVEEFGEYKITKSWISYILPLIVGVSIILRKNWGRILSLVLVYIGLAVLLYTWLFFGTKPPYMNFILCIFYIWFFNAETVKQEFS